MCLPTDKMRRGEWALCNLPHHHDALMPYTVPSGTPHRMKEICLLFRHRARPRGRECIVARGVWGWACAICRRSGTQIQITLKRRERVLIDRGREHPPPAPEACGGQKKPNGEVGYNHGGVDLARVPRPAGTSLYVDINHRGKHKSRFFIKQPFLRLYFYKENNQLMKNH